MGKIQSVGLSRSYWVIPGYQIGLIIPLEFVWSSQAKIEN